MLETQLSQERSNTDALHSETEKLLLNLERV